MKECFYHWTLLVVSFPDWRLGISWTFKVMQQSCSLKVLRRCGLCNGEEFLIGVTQPRRVMALVLVWWIWLPQCWQLHVEVAAISVSQMRPQNPWEGHLSRAFLSIQSLVSLKLVALRRVGQELNNSGKVGHQARQAANFTDFVSIPQLSDRSCPTVAATQVRYDRSNCTKDMRIKFMTDGILLREAGRGHLTAFRT